LSARQEAADVRIAELPGDRIDRYRLVEKLGEGGCGVVYLAEQTEPIRRQVALKIIKLGMDTRQVIARFEAERQALAMMDHPHIAKVLDAGATQTGRPYFVMELVPGVKITDHCDQNKLTTEERLKLFIQVCSAIQHAHQKGVIHRDLKPSNILVAIHDGVPTPKIIDFGIAKATDPGVGAETSLTLAHQFLGTPAYMSPEQAGLGKQDIDTRSDIYSLGVLLYELLTRQLPYDREELLRAGLDEMRRLIREQEPPKPSTRLSTLNAVALSEVAQYQQTLPPKLVHSVRGDLDWIVMKCLEKDRGRRYETATELAQDLERHLHHEPVTAAAPATLYRTRKFVRKYRYGLATATALVLLLVAGVAASLWQAVRATRAEHEQGRLLTEAESARTEAIQQRERAEAGRAEAQAQRAEAQAQRSEAQKQRAEAETQRAKALDALQIAETEQTRAERAHNQASNEWARAEAALENARQQRDNLEKTMGFMLYDLSDKLMVIGKADLLRSVTEEVLAHYQALPPDGESEDSLSRRYMAFRNLAQILAMQGESARALESFRTSLAIAEKLLARTDERSRWRGELGLCHGSIGELLLTAGDSSLARVEFQASLNLGQPLTEEFPAESRWVVGLVNSHLNLGEILWMNGDSRRASAECQAALATAREFSRHNPTNQAGLTALAAAYRKVGFYLLEQRQTDLAQEAYSSGLVIAKRLVAADTGNNRFQADLALGHDGMGDVLLASGETAAAVAHYQEALDIRKRMVEAAPDNTIWKRNLLRSYIKVGRALSQDTTNPKIIAVLKEGIKAVLEIHKTHRDLMGKLLSADNRTAEPIESFQESLRMARELTGMDTNNIQWQNDLAQSYSSVGEMLLQARRNADALEAFREALSIRTKLAERDVLAASHQYWLSLARVDVAVTLGRLGRREEALSEARSALDVFAARTARWPASFAFMGAPRLATATGVGLARQIQAEVEAIFRRGFEAAKSRAGKSLLGTSDRKDWADYCSQAAAGACLLGDYTTAVWHVQNAENAWQELSLTATNSEYQAGLTHARIALGRLQLANQQPQSALETARRGLESNPDRMEFLALAAMSHVLDGQLSEALAILVAKQKRPAGPYQTFGEAVLDDLHLLADESVARSHVERLEQLLKTELPAAAE